MKLGIYGDSFCQDTGEGTWPTELANLLGVSDYRSYGCGGTSIEYSYFNFLESHHLYDIIIFCATGHNRTSIIDYDFKEKKYEHHMTANWNVFKNEDNRNRRFSQEGDPYNPEVSWNYNQKVLKHEYIKFKNYKNPYKIYHDAIRNSLKFIRSDIKIYECFPPHMDRENHGALANVALADFSKNYPKLDRETYSMYEKERPNHYSYKQNLELARLLHKDISFDVNIHNCLKMDTLENYFDLSGEGYNVDK